MDVRQLNALLAVAEQGSFSAAARSLHTVQSNVSAHVARLEKELGAVLIDRTSGLLTPEGEIVAARARRVQAEIDAMASDVASLRAQVVGTARLGVIGTTARWLVPSLFEAMAERYPEVELVVTDATTSSLLLTLLSGRLDMAVVNFPIDEPEVATEHLFDEDPLLVAPQGHHLHERDRIALAELDGERLLLEPRGTAFRDELDQRCAAIGIELRAQAEVDGMRLLATLAFDGFGAAILPATAAPTRLEGRWRRIPIDGLDPRSVGLATMRRSLLSAPARALHGVIRDVVHAKAPQQQGVHLPPEVSPAVPQ